MFLLILFLLLWAPGIIVNVGFLNAYSDAFNILITLVILILVAWRRVFILPSKNIIFKIILINIILILSLFFSLIYSFKIDFAVFMIETPLFSKEHEVVSYLKVLA
jgi:hypothetical protein